MMRSPGRAAAGAVVGALALLAAMAAPAAAYPRPGTTERVSVNSDGSEANLDGAWGSGAPGSISSAISAGGRYVAFQSSSLTTGNNQVFVHDRTAGTTEMVSVASDGTQGNFGSGTASLSADGRYVAFISFATDLVPGDTNGRGDIYVRDLKAGTTERVSVASDGTEGNNSSVSNHAISADGRFVAFSSFSSNLIPGDTNGVPDVFVHDRETGTTERVSVASDGTETVLGFSVLPAITADGRHVAFASTAPNLVLGDTNMTIDVFVHDREAGTTERVSVASDGTEGNFRSTIPDISADGRHVAFESEASNLVPGDTNGAREIFVHDRKEGTTERVSVASDGSEVNGNSLWAAISADGRYVGFDSEASNLVPGDTNDMSDVFIHDRETGTSERVSMASGSDDGDGRSFGPALSADGRHVAFESEASNLVPGDTNDMWDVFVRDRGPAIGVGSLVTQGDSEELTVSGWATFSGATVSSAEDPGNDGEAGARELGAEITGASVTYRPEQEDLLARMDLASLPGVASGSCLAGQCVEASTGGGAPGVLYQWAFTVGDTAYEVRALRPAATADPPAAEPHFALFECTPSCAEVTRLSGGIGTTRVEVRVSVPLEALGAEEGAELTDVEASAAPEEAAPGALVAPDEVELPNGSIPVPQVELGIAPASTSEEDVIYMTEADLVEGEFSATVDVSALAAGDYLLWARGCLADTCGARSVGFTVAGDLIETSLELELERVRGDIVATATLAETDSGVAIGQTEISFFVNGEPVGSELTDAAGRAQITLHRNQFKAHDVLRAVFAGDDRHAASSAERGALDRPRERS